MLNVQEDHEQMMDRIKREKAQSLKAPAAKSHYEEQTSMTA